MFLFSMKTLRNKSWLKKCMHSLQFVMQNIPILSNSEIIKLFIEDMQGYSFACASILKTIIWCILKPSIILSRFVISLRFHSKFSAYSQKFQVLNEYFHNVCELDLVFNFYKGRLKLHQKPKGQISWWK